MATRIGTVIYQRPCTAGAYGIEVVKHTNDTFSIQYGQQVKDGMCLREAAAELGNCIFHALSCEGKLNG